MKWSLFIPLSLAAMISLLGRGTAHPAAPPFGFHGDRSDDVLDHGSMTANSSISTMEIESKRWLHMVPGAEGFGSQWPNGLIIWCFVPGTSNDLKGIVRPALADAWRLWTSVGVDENVLNFREVSGSPPPECPDRSTMLRVTVANTGGMSTTVGYDANSDMSMKLNVDETFGLGDRIANFAHEIGHAWGLLHEHQRPDMWDSTYTGGTGVQNKFNFNCNNLKDYATVGGQITENQLNIACKSFAISQKFNFAGGSNYLPYSADNVVSSAGSLDKKSIMLYRSDQGGLVGDDGIKQSVYTYADGTFIGGNTQPSAGDVANLNDLYPGAKTDTTCLFFMPCSPFETIFRAASACIGGACCSSS